MNQRIDFSKLGGFPATQFTFDFMQASYRNAFTALALMFGDKVILSGVDLIGAQYTDGWISIAGELMPFVGGTAQSEFIIEEIPATRLFQNGQTNTVYFKRQARFGSPGIPFSQLRRMGELMGSIQNLNSHINNYNNPHNVTKNQVGLSAIPNAISDNPYLNNGNVLATTAATFALAAANKVIYVGSHHIGDLNWDDMWTVNHNQDISGNYIVTGSLVSNNDWNSDNDATWIIGEKKANYFKLITKQLAGTFQDLYFDYALIRI